MESVNERDEDGWRQDDQQYMTKQEVGTPEGHLDDLDEIFTGWLREGRRTKLATVPNTGPPCDVGLVRLELARQEHGDENLLNRPLYRDDTNDSKDGMGCVPKFEEPL